MEYKISEYASVMPGYRQDSVLKPRPFYHTGFKETLERIVLNEEPQKERGIVDKVFSDKGRTLKETIKALFNEIQTRERLDHILLSDINEDMCRQHSSFEQVKSIMRFNYSTDFLDYFSKAKMQIEDKVLDLEKEKRKEYLECWKDLMFLKKYLLSALKDYWNASSSKSFLNIENDKPGHRIHMQKTEAYNW
ncbi:MAG: hypothetical protein Q8L26_08560 [Candidatus Omnitrophota bacterium]|nr:hypothetical protein [Candidatus Omnitrophota bacterium]